jgi:hypothetical protein
MTKTFYALGKNENELLCYDEYDSHGNGACFTNQEGIAFVENYTYSHALDEAVGIRAKYKLNMYYVEMNRMKDTAEYKLSVNLMRAYDELLEEQKEVAAGAEKNIDNFTREMTELSLKYGIWVGGFDDGAYLAKVGSYENLTGGENTGGGFTWKGDHYETELCADYQARQKREWEALKKYSENTFGTGEGK